ncbi:MAG: hypothetical protein RLN72_10055 [Henriciella sp.]
MSGRDLAFFIAGLLVFFVFALAVQMRIMTGIVLKRAAKAKFDRLEEAPARFAVVAASGGRGAEPEGLVSEAADWLAAEYPAAIGHLRLARKSSVMLGGLFLGVIAAWRLTGGES